MLPDFSDSKTNLVIGDGASVNISEANVAVLDEFGDPVLEPTVNITEVGDSVVIEGVEQGWTIQFIGDSDFNSVEIENWDAEMNGDEETVDGNPFSIGEFGFDIVTAGDEIDLAFDLAVTDEGGDTSSGVLDITANPEGGVVTGTAEGEALIGGNGDDLLSGEGGADILTGNEGADGLTGGAGADIFVSAEGDGGAIIALADIISDFEDGTDLIGLEGGLTFADLTIDQSADVVGDGTLDTVISVTATSEFLTVLDGIDGGTTIDVNDFTVVV